MNHSPENPEQAESQTGFLQRWSRRKSEPDQQPAEPVEALDVGQADPAEAPLQVDDSADQPAEVAPLTDDDMPPLETLDADSDYTPFMSSGVSNELRQLALKKLFFSGLFRERDGLDDYDDDFTRFEPLGDTITSDMKFHQRREERARLAREQSEREAEEQAQLEQLAERDETGPEQPPAESPGAEEDEITAAESAPDRSQPDDGAEQPDDDGSAASPATTDDTGKLT